MIYLVLAIACSSLINIGLTYSKKRDCEELNVTLFNYITASSISLVMLLTSGGEWRAPDFKAAWQNVMGIQTAEGSIAFAIVIGVATGVFYLMGILITQRSIEKNGPSPTTIFSRLGILIPILCAIFVWKEIPDAIQWVGIIIAFAALILYNYDGGFKVNLLLLAMFFVSGIGELTNKFFTEWCMEVYKPLFFFSIFFTSLVICSVMCLKSKARRKIRMKDALIGCSVGVVNLSSSFFIVKSLSVMPASIMYPLMCAGVILTIAVVSRIFFDERLTKREYLAVGLTIVSLVLVNV